MVNPATGWLYTGDYEAEAPDPWLNEAGGAPQQLVFEQAGPDVGNPLQDGLAGNSSMYTFPGRL
jgi:hypothetical protein